MIKGIGTDIIEIQRIKNLINKFGDKFLERIYTAGELASADALKEPNLYHAFLAKRFAAKEAYAKALGTGIGNNISFNQIEINNTPEGCPKLVDLKNTLRSSENKIHVSLSDTEKYAIAYVVIESK